MWIHVGDHLTSVNTSMQWYKDKLFSLACHALQEFYLKDPSLTESWDIVQKITNRNVYNILPITSIGNDNDEECFGVDAEDEDDTDLSNNGPINENDLSMLNPLHQFDEEHLAGDLSTILQVVMVEESEDDNIDKELGMKNINDGDNAGKVATSHLHDYTDDDDGKSYALYCS